MSFKVHDLNAERLEIDVGAVRAKMKQINEWARVNNY